MGISLRYQGLVKPCAPDLKPETAQVSEPPILAVEGAGFRVCSSNGCACAAFASAQSPWAIQGLGTVRPHPQALD